MLIGEVVLARLRFVPRLLLLTRLLLLPKWFNESPFSVLEDVDVYGV